MMRRRGDRVRITPGRYAEHKGTVESNVYQRTVDYPGEFAKRENHLTKTATLKRIWFLAGLFLAVGIMTAMLALGLYGLGKPRWSVVSRTPSESLQCDIGAYEVRLTPELRTEVHDEAHQDITGLTALAGTTVHDAVFVTGSGPTPTGQVSFERWDNSDCGGMSTVSPPVVLSGGVAESPNFITTSDNVSYRLITLATTSTCPPKTQSVKAWKC